MGNHRDHRGAHPGLIRHCRFGPDELDHPRPRRGNRDPEWPHSARLALHGGEIHPCRAPALLERMSQPTSYASATLAFFILTNRRNPSSDFAPEY